VVRLYRDLSQHHVVVSSDPVVVITNGEIESFFVPLPSNPEVKRPEDLRYEVDSPNGLPYCVDSFLAVCGVTRQITRELLGDEACEPSGFKWVGFKSGLGSAGLPRNKTPLKFDALADLLTLSEEHVR